VCASAKSLSLLALEVVRLKIDIKFTLSSFFLSVKIKKKKRSSRALLVKHRVKHFRSDFSLRKLRAQKVCAILFEVSLRLAQVLVREILALRVDEEVTELFLSFS